MEKFFLLNTQDEAERQSKEPGQWVVATLETRTTWPTQRQVVLFDGKVFLLIPQSTDKTLAPGIALRSDLYHLDYASARREIMKFCSAMSWIEGGGLTITYWGGGRLPNTIGARVGGAITNFLELPDLPIGKTKEERAALAFYREGISLDNPFYATLSLFKAISVLFPDGKERGKWIAEALTYLDSSRAIERYKALQSQVDDVGEYLRDDCRNAIAHAGKEPYIDPDDADDHFRLYQDIPIFMNLAELAIERQTTLRRRRTIWQEHLYELAGFKDVFPSELVRMLKQSELVPGGTTVEVPESYTILARRGPEVVAFENMKSEISGQIQGGMILDFITDDHALRIRLLLAFNDERLIFDPLKRIGFTPDRASASCVRHEIQMLRFMLCVLSNGHVEVWDQERNVILGRSEGYLPLNAIVNVEFFEAEISRLNAILESSFPEE